MKNITLRFSCVKEVLDFIRLSRICNYEFSLSLKLLTADLSIEQLCLAETLCATVTDCCPKSLVVKEPAI